MKSFNGYMLYIALVASLGGFLFGFDTAVISGAESAIQEVYNLSDYWHGFTIAVALFGTIIGTIICGKPSEQFGRKKVMITIAFIYFVSAIGSGLIVNWYSFMIFRFIGGIAVGASSVVGPMYIAEISPANWRGRFVAFFQFNIVLGIVIAYLSNYALSGLADDWRWMVGVEGFPAIVLGFLMFTVPESPRWLVKIGKADLAKLVFEKIGNNRISHEIIEIKESLKNRSKRNEKLFQKKYSKPLIYAFLIATFNQLSGINAILYYAPRIFERAGILGDSALIQSFFIGMINLVFTMIAMIIIDKIGRKKLLIIGAMGMALSLSMVSYGFYYNSFSGYSMLLYLGAFIASFAISLGAVIWVLISEIFPTDVRSKGQVFGSLTHWMWNAILSWIFPIIVGGFEFGGAIMFGLFAVMMLLNFFFGWLVLPETKNKSLEQLQKELVKE